MSKYFMNLFLIIFSIFIFSAIPVSAENTIEEGIFGENYDLLSDIEYESEPILIANGGTYNEKPAPKPLVSSEWQFFIAPYLWFVGIEGDMGIRGNEFEVDVSFGDIWDALDFAFQIHAEAMRNNYFFFIDETYMKLSVDEDIEPINILPISADLEVELKQNMLEFGGGYRLTSGNQSIPLYFDLLGGLRWLYIDTELGINSLSTDESEHWADLFIGARAIAYLTDSIFATIRTDIGGFGFGFSSDIAWNFIINLGWDTGWHGLTPYIGWRALYIDYEDGSGDDKFIYDVWLNGIQTGIGFRF